MENSEHPLVRLFLTVVALVGSIHLQDVALIMGMITTGLTGAYAALQFYVLWRDKIRKRSSPPTKPMPLGD